jgi:phosphate transport system protein
MTAMGAALQRPEPESDNDRILFLTLKAFELAKSAVSHVADGLVNRTGASFAAADECERGLDAIDRQVDEGVPAAIIGVDAEKARELLACLKCVTDLERVGDLVASLGARARAISARLETDDVTDLVRMATLVEHMLGDLHRALSNHDVEGAVNVLRTDAEIDRIRNLLHIRHVENREGIAGPEGVQVLFMAQALERAGDHAKNIAEEVCHLVSGHSVRHMMRASSKSEEQMFIDWLREQQRK